MTDWIIWYDDKSSFSSDDGAPWDAPREGVACISVPHESCGRYVLGEVDFYCWHFEDTQWVPHDRIGMLQYLRKPGKEKVVIEGYWMAKDRYIKIKRQAKRIDTRLPAMTAEGIGYPEGVRHYLED
jgi:hypothetical protein